MSILDPVVKPIQDEMAKVEKKLLNGDFKDYAEARNLVGRREGLRVAIEIVKAQVQLEVEAE